MGNPERNIGMYEWVWKSRSLGCESGVCGVWRFVSGGWRRLSSGIGSNGNAWGNRVIDGEDGR